MRGDLDKMRGKILGYNRVQPPLSERELVDMFLGTLSGPFFNHLIGSSSAGFIDLILM